MKSSPSKEKAILKKRPLVSYILCSYNQEKVIEEAILSAFSQTYTPLEIILSDDCSTDSTFSVMKRMAKTYRGQHKIRLNCNQQNMGISAHFARAVEMAHSEFIIAAAGDDVSLPEYSEELAKPWINSNKQVLLVYSDARMMDMNGDLLDDIRKPAPETLTDCKTALLKNAGTIGAATGYSKRLFTEFPPIDPAVIHEDKILPVRALLMGKTIYINKALINYRVGGISYGYDKISVSEYLYGEGNILAQRYVEDYKQKLTDLNAVQADSELISLARKQLAQWQLIAFLGKERRMTCKVALDTLKHGISPGFLIKNVIKYLLPTPYHFLVNHLKTP